MANHVVEALRRHPGVRLVKLVGSRAEGRENARSDWDFRVETEDFASVASALPDLLAPLQPLAVQWDRLSESECFMLTLRGPVKIDLLFVHEPHEAEPPWRPDRDNLTSIDQHFWDWMLWLASKSAKGERRLVQEELHKLFHHLLVPLGVARVPGSIADAVAVYREARGDAERRLHVKVPSDLETEVAPALPL